LRRIADPPSERDQGISGCWGSQTAPDGASAYQSQAQVHFPWGNLARRTCHLTDELNGNVFERNGNEMASTGLYVDLPSWRFYFLSFQSE
jgi:hypothetical protein